MAERVVTVRLQAIAAPYVQGTSQATAATRGMQAQVATSAQRMSANWRQVGMAATAVGVGVLLAGKSAGDAAIDFESATTKMVTQIGLAREEADELGQAALGLTDTTRGPQELADALFFVTSAGFRGAEALDVVEASAKAAAIGMGETAQVADLVTSAVNAYGSETLSAEQATDVLVGTVREGKAEASQLTAAMGQVLPVASEMGVRFDEVGAAIAGMTRTGTNAGTAAMQLRQILAGLLNPTQGVEEAMARMGLSSEALRATIRDDGLWQALMDLRDATGGNEQALGELFPNVRALAGFLDLTGANADQTAATFAELEDTTGMLNDGFDAFGDTAEASQQKASAAWEAARIRIGEATIGMRTQIAETSASIAESIADMDDATAETVATFGAAAGGTATLGGAALLAAPKIGAMLAPLLPLAPAIGAAAVAAGGAAVAYQRYARFKRDAAEATQAFLQAVQDEEQSGDPFPTLHTIAQDLERVAPGAVSTLLDMGIALSDVKDAIEGGEEGYQALMDRIHEASDATVVESERQLTAVDAVSDVVGRLGVELEEAYGSSEEIERVTQALIDDAVAGERWAEVAELAAMKGDDLSASMQMGAGMAAAHAAGMWDVGEAAESARPALRDLSIVTDDLAVAVERWEQALDSLSGTAISVDQAHMDFLDTLEGLEDALDEDSKALDKSTEAGRGNRREIIAGIEAAQAHSVAMVEDGESVLDAASATVEHIDALRDEAIAAGVSADEFDELIELYNLTPREVRTVIVQQGLNEVLLNAERLREVLSGINDTYHVRVRQTVSGDSINVPSTRVAPGGSTQFRAEGGPVTRGTPYIVGEEGPELFTPSESGFVHDATSTARMVSASDPILQAAGGSTSSVDRSKRVEHHTHVGEVRAHDYHDFRQQMADEQRRRNRESYEVSP